MVAKADGIKCVGLTKVERLAESARSKHLVTRGDKPLAVCLDARAYKGVGIGNSYVKRNRASVKLGKDSEIALKRVV